MKNKNLNITAALGALALSMAVAGNARAVTIAGWDFSQYFSSGILTTTDDFAPANTLAANYSNLDPTFSAGAESAAFGTMFMNGTNGSSLVDIPPATLAGIFSPFTGSLSQNLNAPVDPAFPDSVPFDTFSVLASEGQPFRELLSMTATAPVQIVFGATLGSVPEFGTDFLLAFAGQTFSGSHLLGLEYSVDGALYQSLPSQTLGTSEALFQVPIPVEQADQVFVRLSFFSQGGGQPLIDNLSIEGTTVIPEPGTALLLALGLAGIAACRFRSRA